MDYNLMRRDIERALYEIEKKYNVSVSLGTISYDDVGFRVTLTGKVKDAGNGKSGAQIEYEMYANKFGIDPASFGKSFICKGEKYIITGINPKARTMPILAKDSAGRPYKFTVAATGFRSPLVLKDIENVEIIVHNFGKEE